MNSDPKETAVQDIAINTERDRSISAATMFSSTWQALKILPVVIVAIAALPLLGILMLMGTRLRHDSYDVHDRDE